jgi:hypothetical protein
LIHAKCKKPVDVSFLKGGYCKACCRRWYPIINFFSTDLRPLPIGEARETKHAKFIKKVETTPRGQRRRHAKWADGTPGGAAADLLPNWSRKWRLLIVALLLSVVGALIWMAMR